jgi:tRNA(fMet)-specific endonuclease VapC
MPTVIGYLLDTNILLELARGNPRGQAIDARFALSSSLSSSMISVVTVGEMLALSRKVGWGQSKIGALRKMLDELVWIDINRQEILEAYAEIDHVSESIGICMGKNDVWIAATAKATGATLITTDPDFNHLHGTHITRIWFDPDMRKSP